MAQLTKSTEVSESEVTSKVENKSQSIVESTSTNPSASESKSLSAFESKNLSDSQSENVTSESKPTPKKEFQNPVDLIGDVPGPVMYKNAYGQLKKARFQPPYPTPLSITPHVWTEDDTIYGIAEDYGVSLQWIRRCNRMEYEAMFKIKPGKVLKFAYTPHDVDYVIKRL
ncbi:LysM peptidoglycan-binding domain-containing protein [Ligilactobacillus equi]